jgi:hypothetical protein
MHSGLRRRVKERGAAIIDLTAPTWMIRDRLDLRGEDEATVNRRINETFESGYDSEFVADQTLDTGQKPPEVVAAAIAGLIT